MASVLERLDRLSKEVRELKRVVFHQAPPKRKVSLKGVLRGAKIHEKDIQAARRSLFPAARTR